ncbi:hypothetical protein ACSDR0_45270 [Streptosporangium sp. G11]|uniref:hypothetical protein n=1 Tax=Streptosporangium sp. G11 TaxID=3436926 RepID=UPI003EBCF12C
MLKIESAEECLPEPGWIPGDCYQDPLKDALIGELPSKTSRQLLAECLAHREEEGFYDDDLDDLVAPRMCGELHPSNSDDSYVGHCTLPLDHGHRAIRPPGGPSGRAAGPDCG